MTDLSTRSEDLERQLDPQVISKADPDGTDLLQARADVQAHPHLQSLFRQSSSEGWSPDDLAQKLAGGLREIWPDGDPTDAAQFLADEYSQIGPTGVHIISRETGRIVAVIREEDIYQPAPVPREGGGMAQPLKRIRPDLEAAIVTWHHDRDRERQIVEGLAAKGHQTALLRELGDPRLLVATKKGRRHIVESLAKIPPKALLEAAGGTARAFLQYFELTEGDPPITFTAVTHIEGSVTSKSVMRVQDPSTTNLHHNRAATLQGALVQGWVREMARLMSLRVKEKLGVQELQIQSATELPGKLWVAPPDMVRPFRKVDPDVMVLPVERSIPTMINGPLGYIKIPEVFRANNLEIFDRWEASTSLDFELWLAYDNVKAFHILGLDQESQLL